MSGLSKSSTSIPGPPSHLGWVANAVPFMLDAVPYMLRLYRTYGEIVTLAENTNRFVFIFSPGYNRLVLSNPNLFYNGDFKSSPVRVPENSAAGRLFNGLVVMNGDKHAQQRRLMLPAFHKKRVEAYRDTMVELTEQRMSGWIPGQSYDFLEEMRQLTLSIVIKTLFGLDPAHEGSTIRNIFEQAAKVGFSPLSMLIQLDLPGLPYYRMLRATEKVEAEILALIDRKRAEGLDQGDVLSMLLQAHDEDGTRLTDAELSAQVMTLFTAGHETTASALCWTLFLLSQHPRVLSDLEDELQGGLHGDAPTLEQLEQLPLLERVIKESMRLLPPFLWNLRMAQADFELGPYRLPKGTTLVYTPAITHRIPELYPQPDKFFPERWLNFEPSPYEYLPFAAGPRRCLGATFAMLEMKIVLALLLQRYRLSLPPGTRVDRGARLMLSSPKPGLPLLVNRLDQPFVKCEVRGNIRALVDLT